MKKKEIIYDEHFDKECVALCQMLNKMPNLMTVESCCGHLRDRFMVWFNCDDFSTLATISRAVNRNYSDGKWELLVDGSDTQPVYQFWLRSKEPFKTQEEMDESVKGLIENLEYWSDSKFDDYFSSIDYD